MISEERMNAAVDIGPCGRMSRVFREKKRIKIMFLGGSITAGSAECETTPPYPEIVCEKLREIYPDKEIICQNLGESTFPSAMGLMKYIRFAGELCPDVVFTEFAVNDGFDRFNAEYFESLVRRIINSEWKPAAGVICTFRNDGYSCEAYMTEIAEHYGISSVSVKTALEGTPYEEYSNDGLHPHYRGHQLIAELTLRMIENAADGEDTPVSDECCYGNSTEHLKYYDRRTLSPDSIGSFTSRSFERFSCEGWQYDGSVNNDNEPMRFVIPKEKHSGMMCVVHLNGNDCKVYGAADIIVNGKVHATLDSYSIYGWDNPVMFGVFLDNGVDNIVEIKMHKGDEGKRFDIMGFGI